MNGWMHWITTRGDVLSEERRIAMLMCCLGMEGQTQYRTLGEQRVPAADGQDIPDTRMVARLSLRFADSNGLTAARFEFRNRRQLPGETVAEFVASLRRLATR